MTHIFQMYIKIQKNYDDILVTNSSGLVLDDGRDQGAILKKTNLADRKYFQSAKSGKITIGEPVISKASGNSVFVIAVPLRNSSGRLPVFLDRL